MSQYYVILPSGHHFVDVISNPTRDHHLEFYIQSSISFSFPVGTALGKQILEVRRQSNDPLEHSIIPSPNMLFNHMLQIYS